MDPVAIVLGLAMLVAASAFVLNPFRAKSQRAFGGRPEQASAGERRTAAVSALRDLDFDHRTGKVSDEDYSALRAGLMQEAARYMQAADHEDAQLEALIRARRKAAAHEHECPSCKAGLSGEERFCPRCGTEVSSACPMCGVMSKPGDLFCSSCGSRMQPAKEAAVA